ncbi:MAG: NADH-quinone oxidoreductase subunit NuoE [Chloroflexi bacterium]|nr:NADH-quinone oxidoreductase subunit NuoE [Chloroflexota bacterium]
MPVLSEATRAQIRAELERYPERRTALLPALRAIQAQFGWLPPEALHEAGELTGFDANALAQLASFYSLLYLKPVGAYVLQMCNNAGCYLAGADSLIEHLEQRLGVKVGQTTPDGVFSLRLAECIAGCDRAPAMMVNRDHVENLTRERLDELLATLRHEHESRSAAGSTGRNGAGPASARPAASTTQSEEEDNRG